MVVALCFKSGIFFILIHNISNSVGPSGDSLHSISILAQFGFLGSIGILFTGLIAVFIAYYVDKNQIHKERTDLNEKISEFSIYSMIRESLPTKR